jgi:hypothetical protein
MTSNSISASGATKISMSRRTIRTVSCFFSFSSLLRSCTDPDSLSTAAKASIYSTKDGKVTQAFNDHSGNSTDTLNGKKVGKKDDDKKKNDAKKKDDGKDNYGKKDDGKGNGKKRRALLGSSDLSPFSTSN